MKDYDSWLQDIPDREVFCECEFCGNEIYKGNECYRLANDDIVHIECFTDYTWSVFDPMMFVAGKEE